MFYNPPPGQLSCRVGCALTSHSAVFQLHSDGTVVQFSNLDLLPGTQRHGYLRVFSKPSPPRYVRLGYCFTPYQRLQLYNGAPLVAFYDTLGIRRTYSRLKTPGVLTGSPRYGQSEDVFNLLVIRSLHTVRVCRESNTDLPPVGTSG